LLKIENLSVFHGDVQALRSVTMDVEQGEIIALVGANAAGKSTLVDTLAGVHRPKQGKIEFLGEDITRVPGHLLVERGLVLIPEGRHLFPFMSVMDNLNLGCYWEGARKYREETLAKVLAMFPALAERRDQLAVSLSGGEQQMCAIARGLMARPRLLILDEPSLGLAPLLVQKTLQVVKEINAAGTTILLVEQNVQHALQMSHRGYVLENGTIVMGGAARDLLNDPHLKKAYLGI
jgi:branched-chain amino acid transport system ATP-binding protein